MAGFLFLRVRAHRLLLLAALLAVLLTTSVLATLAAFSGSIGDAALRDTLQGREAASAALVVNADTAASAGPGAAPGGADRAVAAGARRTFDGLPVTVRKLATSGAYALPGASGATDAADDDQPDLTHFATLDRSRVRLVSGGWPKATAGTRPPVPVALPQEAAARLGLKTGDTLTLTDRVAGTPVRIRVTGVYRAADLTDVYWQLDELHGRGVRTVVFTTYGPLLTDGADLASGRLSSGETSWLATGDFRTVTTGRIGALREAAEHGPKALAADRAFAGGAPEVRTALPAVLDRTQRALLVSRSTLMIVAVQLVLLAGYALLLVARLLSTERAGETELLRARGGSRRRITLLAAAEALLLAVPAALCAPLFAGPLTRLLADRSALTAIGLRLGKASTGQVWLVAAVVALACAAAVVAPALASPGTPGTRRGRAGTLPAPV
ncbi:hypothetical protein QR77_11695, partial [Streptomyces sp. 150FB]|uniref:FtsX-like permease family protein n=1 Tax=Streptomyces sp. 150FB TaxID=1576605 RepID=UPI000589623B